MCWVRPGFLEAKANCFCWVRVLIQVDFPAFDLPTKAISGTSMAGKKCSWGAVVKNLAVCNHPKATTAGDLADSLGVASAVDKAGGFVVVVMCLSRKPGAAL